MRLIFVIALSASLLSGQERSTVLFSDTPKLGTSISTDLVVPDDVGTVRVEITPDAADKLDSRNTLTVSLYVSQDSGKTWMFAGSTGWIGEVRSCSDKAGLPMVCANPDFTVHLPDKRWAGWMFRVELKSDRTMTAGALLKW